MSDLRPEYTKIDLGGKEYGMLLSIGAVDKIQDRLDIPLSEVDTLLDDERKAYKTLTTIVTIMVNEAIEDSETGEPHITEEFVSRKIKFADLLDTKRKLVKSVTDGVSEQSEDEADPNAKSE